MERSTPTPEGVSTPPFPFSPVVVSGDLVFVAGQAPVDADGALVSGGFAAQAHQVFLNLERCLAAAGCSLTDVVKVTAFLSDLAHFASYNDVYREYFAPPYPARTTVGATLLGFDIEVEAIARRPSGAC